jgi:hypothetical protein
MTPDSQLVDLTCRRVTELADEYLEQRLGVDAHACFEQHLHACTWCMTYVAQLRATLGMLRRLGADNAGIPAGRDKLAVLFRRWKQETP